MSRIRYYMGRHRIIILHNYLIAKKVQIMHLETGYVGNKSLGYKTVHRFDCDITMVRNCWRNKK